MSEIAFRLEKVFYIVAILVAVLFGFSGFGDAAYAQTGTTGALVVTVTDPSGASVADADARVVNTTTGEVHTAKTGSDGTATAPLLPPGTYKVEIRKSGFALQVADSVQVIVTETRRLPIRLTLQGQIQTVEVTSAAPEVVQTQESTLGRLVDAVTLQNVPLVVRNYTQIMTLSPEITADVTDPSVLGRGNGGLGTYGQGGGFNAHGDYTFDNNFQMNGIGVNDFFAQANSSGGTPIPNPDTIQEVKVQTGQFDATYGRGGASVNFVTRGGTNKLHGVLFEYLRNTDLDANNWFSNLNGQPRSVLNQNQFGFTLGGPIKKNRLFFFGSYQGTRQNNGLGNVHTVLFVPLTGDRSAQGIANVLYGPGTTPAARLGYEQNALGGVGPAVLPDGSNINPIALALLQMKLPNGQYMIPTPQTVNPAAAWANQGSSTYGTASMFHDNQYMFNVDYNVSPTQKLSGRYFDDLSNQSTPFPGSSVPGWPNHLQDRFIDPSLSYTWTIKQTLLNEVDLGFDRLRVTTSQTAVFNPSSMGINVPPESNTYPAISIGSFSFGTPGSPVGQRLQNFFVASDTLSWIHGKHSFRFGGGDTKMQRNFTRYQQDSSLTFQSFADFLLGLNATQNGTNLYSNVYGSSTLLGLFDRSVRDTWADLYAQDDYRVNSRLTLNLGFRWEFLPRMTDKMGRFSDVYAGLLNPNPPASGALTGYVVTSNYPETVPSGVTQTNSEGVTRNLGDNAFDPRVGFALRLLPKSSRLVLRGGYGLYSSLITGEVQTLNTSTPPFGYSASHSGTTNSLATFANPFASILTSIPTFPYFPPYSPSTALSSQNIDPNIQPGRLQEYSLNLQVAVTKDTMWEVGYQGTAGRHMLGYISLNQAGLTTPTVPTTTVANVQQRVPFIGWGASSIYDVDSNGTLNYNSLETSLTKRVSHGLTFLMSYTFSKTLITNAANADSSSGGTPAVGNQNDPAARYGPAIYSRPQRFVASYSYELPWFKKAHTLEKAFLGGWIVSGATEIQSGHPLSLTGSNSQNAFGISSNMAQLAPGCSSGQLAVAGSVQSRVSGYLNSNCINRKNLNAPLSSTSNPATWPVIGTDGLATDFGNLGPGDILGPDQNNWNISVAKQFDVPWPKEAANLQFRSDFFNAFNHPQFSSPDTGVTDAAFGHITSTSTAPRVIQFSLRFTF